MLFSGTPCQTAGLASFLGNKFREKLILVDIVCHGVPAPYIWRDYIDYLEQKHHSQVINVDFRNKKSLVGEIIEIPYTLQMARKMILHGILQNFTNIYTLDLRAVFAILQSEKAF